MKTALCLGGGDSLFDDIASYRGPIDGVIACNDAGVEWDGDLDAWVSLHPEKFQSAWLKKRREAGRTPPRMLVAHRQPKPHICPILDLVTDYVFPGQKNTGSSGLFTAKVALVDLDFDRVVLCGIPMTQTPHFFDGKPWRSAESYQKQWLTIPPPYRARMRSRSGWTRAFLGAEFQED